MSSVSSSAQNYSRFETRVQSRLNADIASGKISAADGTALGSALGDIQQQLTASTTQSTSSSTGKLGTTVGSLIDGEVSSGKLTSAQADELKSLLGGGHRVGGGHHGHKSQAAKSDSSDQDSDHTQTRLPGVLNAASSNAADSSAAADPLAEFLKILQSAQQTLSSSSYNAAGTSATKTQSSSLGLVDTTA